MPLFVSSTHHPDQAFTDLLLIVDGDPNLTIGASNGVVTEVLYRLSSDISSFGQARINDIVNSSNYPHGKVVVFGVDSGFSVLELDENGNWVNLVVEGGVTLLAGIYQDPYTGVLRPGEIDCYYEIDPCPPLGYVFASQPDAGGNRHLISSTPWTNLFHELAHAHHLFLEDAGMEDIGTEFEEQQKAIEDENGLRAERAMELRDPYYDSGYCSSPANDPQQQQQQQQQQDGWPDDGRSYIGPFACFILTAATPDIALPTLLKYKKTRDAFVRSHDIGEPLFSTILAQYDVVSPAIANRIRSSLELRGVVARFVVAPFMDFLELVHECATKGWNGAQALHVPTSIPTAKELTLSGWRPTLDEAEMIIQVLDAERSFGVRSPLSWALVDPIVFMLSVGPLVRVDRDEAGRWIESWLAAAPVAVDTVRMRDVLRRAIDWQTAHG